MAKANLTVVIKTPVGTLEYPWLNKADTKYDKPHGTFRTNILIPFEEAQEVIAQIEKVRSDFIDSLEPQIRGKYTPLDVYEEVLDDKGAPTGDIRIKTKLKAFVETDDGGFSQSVVIVDSEDGAAVLEPVYSGTMARIKLQAVPYKNDTGVKSVGVSLRVRSVQVHELVTGSGGNWADFS